MTPGTRPSRRRADRDRVVAAVPLRQKTNARRTAGSSTHRNAVEAAIAAVSHDLDDTDGPLLELARTLADQMDDAGEDGPSARLAGAYLTCVRTLHARMSAMWRPPRRDGTLAALRRDASRRIASAP